MSSGRPLDAEESRVVREGLESRWGIPIGSKLPRSRRRWQIERFSMALCELEEAGLMQLVLGSRGVSSIYELRWGEDRELAIEEMVLDGAGTWTDRTLDWLVDAEYEDDWLITVAGALVLQDLRDVWPDWRKWRYH